MSTRRRRTATRAGSTWSCSGTSDGSGSSQSQSRCSCLKERKILQLSGLAVFRLEFGRLRNVLRAFKGGLLTFYTPNRTFTLKKMNTQSLWLRNYLYLPLQTGTFSHFLCIRDSIGRGGIITMGKRILMGTNDVSKATIDTGSSRRCICSSADRTLGRQNEAP